MRTGVGNPRYYREAQKHLRKTQRKVARRKKRKQPSPQKPFNFCNARIFTSKGKRADFHHKISRQLVNNYGVIAVEDLSVKGLASGEAGQVRV
ncbi:MAG: transposase [Pyrinomonadaceae bacterium]